MARTQSYRDIRAELCSHGMPAPPKDNAATVGRPRWPPTTIETRISHRCILDLLPGRNKIPGHRRSDRRDYGYLKFSTLKSPFADLKKSHRLDLALCNTVFRTPRSLPRAGQAP